MPFVYKHRERPEPWRELRARLRYPWTVPFFFSEWIWQWTAYGLAQWSFLEVLEYAGSFSILIAVIFYFADSGERLKQKHYQAWQVINTAQGQRGSGGRIEALRELNEDRVPLVGVDVSDAYLREVRLVEADLRRGDFHGADLRGAILRKSDLAGAVLTFANLRGADSSDVNLTDATLADADLSATQLMRTDVGGVDLSRADLRNANVQDLRNWKAIRSITLANYHGIQNAPDGFCAWAAEHGAVDIASDEEWNRLVSGAGSATQNATPTKKPSSAPTTRRKG